MNILVCLKIVSQATFQDSISDSDDRLKGGALGINPADMYALELALRIKDNHKEAMVTVVTMAPSYAEKVLRDALAAGADRAVLISDTRAAGSDTLVTAKILAAAIKKLPKQELVLCGRKAIDSETGHIGPQLSTLLGIPVLTAVTRFSVKGDKVFAVSTHDGLTAEYSGKLPCILTVVNGTDMVRSPTIMGIRRSKGAEIPVLKLDDIGMETAPVGLDGSPTRTVAVQNISFRKGKGKRVTDIEDGAYELISRALGGERLE